MREGLGTIAIKLRAARRGRELRFENRHLPQVSVYLVNCLADPSGDLAVGRQRRDEGQRSIEFEYSFGAAGPPALADFWPALIGIPLAVRMAMLMSRKTTRLDASIRRQNRSASRGS
jgi:hypothetical protein